jgi:hypothetical protein
VDLFTQQIQSWYGPKGTFLVASSIGCGLFVQTSLSTCFIAWRWGCWNAD